MTAPTGDLFTKIIEEGYCCLHGYLGLCKARGEKRLHMARNIEQSFWTISYHYRAMKRGERPCMGYPDCMLPLIQEIEAEKKPSEEGERTASKEGD